MSPPRKPIMLMGLDLSQHGCGIAYGDGSEPPISSVVDFGDLPRGRLFHKATVYLSDLVVMIRPRLICYEAPLLNTNRPNKAEVPFRLIGLAAIAESVAARYDLACHKVTPQEWRKDFLGRGYPSDPKKAALGFCAALGWDTGGDHNRADAFGVWAWGHLNHGYRAGMHTLLSRMTVRSMER